MIFIDIYDGTDKVQIIAKLPESEESVLQYIDEHIDVADFVEARGTALLSKTGQKSLLINNIRIISKALLPMPDSWHGNRRRRIKIKKKISSYITWWKSPRYAQEESIILTNSERLFE